MTSLDKITKAESVTMYESIRETVKTNENKIISAAPDNFTATLNVSAILTPVPSDTPVTLTSATQMITSTTKSSTESSSTPYGNTTKKTPSKYGRQFCLFFLFSLNPFIYHSFFRWKKVFIGDANGKIKNYNYSSSSSSPASLSLIHSFQAHSDYIERIKVSPFKSSSNYIATSADDFTVKIWSASSSSNWTLIRTFSNHSSFIQAIE